MSQPSVKVGLCYGKLTAIEVVAKNRNGHLKWRCACECGNEAVVFATHLVRGNTKSCGCARVRHGPRHPQWTGFGDISGDMMHNIRRSANGEKGHRKAVPFDLTAKFLWELFLKQGKRCALSNLPLTLPQRHKDARSASLDRIDSSKGYVSDNVQWVHKDINKMKNTFRQGYFVKMCRKVARRHATKIWIESVSASLAKKARC